MIARETRFGGRHRLEHLVLAMTSFGSIRLTCYIHCGIVDLTAFDGAIQCSLPGVSRLSLKLHGLTYLEDVDLTLSCVLVAAL